MYGNTSPMQIESDSIRSGTFQRDSLQREENAAKTPQFLFGNKRRSTVLANGQYSSNADIYNSPLATHLKDNYPGSGKSVHWSPSLVQEKRIDDSFPAPQKAASVAFPTHKGPPLRSLRDNVEPINKVRRMTMPVRPTQVLGPTSPANVSHLEESAFDQDRADAEVRECWVTVFGFSSSDASNIINFFGRHGEIVQHQFPSHGNWVHLRYASPVHASQALSRNGMLFDDQTRIGVMPCKDQDVLNSTTPSRNLNHSRLDVTNNLPLPESKKLNISYVPAFSSPNRHSDSLNDTSLNVSRTSNASRHGMRPLAASYSTPLTNTSVMDDPNQSFLGRLWNLVG